MGILMAMRSQLWQWDNFTGPNSTATFPPGTSMSIFFGGRAFGLQKFTLKPPETTATQFVVIENFGCTPNVGDGSLQILINTTSYFLNPDGLQNLGVPGLASPYPITQDYWPSFYMIPTYILPGQVWDLTYTTISGVTGGPTGDGTPGGDLIQPQNIVKAFVQYTLYDGPDALIANRLLEMGIVIKPDNIDWYKRSLIESQTRQQATNQPPDYGEGQKNPISSGVI